MKTEPDTLFLTLIEDDHFVRWVQSDFVEFDEEWSLFIDSNTENIDQINAAIRVVQGFQVKNKQVVNEQALFEKIKKSTSLPSGQSDSRTFLTLISERKIWLAAASLIILIAAYFAFYTNTEINTNSNEELTAQLPDGSTIQLGAKSSVTYQERDWPADRKLYLDGLAFFDVKKGTKFEVYSKGGVVTVLGTSFSVYARDNYYEVVCRTGKVRVTASDASSVELSPGQKVVAESESGTLVKSLVPSDSPDIPWMQGVFTYENAMLDDVAREIEFQFNIHIDMQESLKQRRYTGFFRKDNLETALQSVFWPLNLEYELQENTVIVKTR